ncbi:hypothetical protein BC938DRAFT_480797 [Jimgerdemannia flammicorona]|uniref:CFA20 domain-containing protein n=1 Tax=Jimgerdemannia flammicorona TaxID=994334 RepID=A0A433QHN1_9FUNG|nr:hypothetical protein BC938DRAFT_480797 [Jimgerdemannia flammicorona]
MFRNTFQSGFLSILYSIGNKPLQLWEKHLPTSTASSSSSSSSSAPPAPDTAESKSRIERIADDDISSLVIELVSPNLAETYITCPAQLNRTLGIKLPFLVLIIKNLNRYFAFEIEVMDDKGQKRRFRASNFQSVTRVQPYICTMPMRLDPGWNQITFHLADFVRRAYGTQYTETLRVTIHANCRLRRVYFTDRVYAEEELPPEFRLFLPVQKNA